MQCEINGEIRAAIQTRIRKTGRHRLGRQLGVSGAGVFMASRGN
jgi:hypothetical protein